MVRGIECMDSFMGTWNAMILVLCAAATAGCAQRESFERFEYTRVCMGVETRVVLYAGGERQAAEAARAAFDRIGELDASMSDYRRDSEVTMLAAFAGSEGRLISDDLLKALTRAMEVSDATNGAFDVTIGPMTQLWRKARDEGRLPEREAWQRARSLVNRRWLEVDEAGRSARLAKQGMRIDLGGIAKGLAAEEAVKAIRAHGVERCLVALAGDVFAWDGPPDQPGWVVGLTNGGASGNETSTQLWIRRGAVSTSGSSEQAIGRETARLSHIIDPRSADGIGANPFMTVTVVADDGATADALATAMCVLGVERGAAVIEGQRGVAAVFRQEDADGGTRTVVVDPTQRLRMVGRAPVGAP